MLLGLPVNHDFAHVMEGRMEETIGRELRIQTITDEVYCLDTGTGTMSTRGHMHVHVALELVAIIEPPTLHGLDRFVVGNNSLPGSNEVEHRLWRAVSNQG